VLRTLEITGHLSRGMIGVVDPDAATSACTPCMDSNTRNSRRCATRPAKVWSAGSWKAAAVARSPAWATSRASSNRLGLYESDLPFIAVPIHVGGTLQGVLAVQPDEPDDGLLAERTLLSKYWPT
jgi:Nif-specific regulatory protein